MTVNPLEYDIGELRDLAGADLDEKARDGLASIDTSNEVNRPYLTSIPNTGELVVYRWLNGLMSTAGYEGTVTAIEYYRFAQWLSKDAQKELHNYLLGVGHREGEGFQALDKTAHMESLGYIAYLSTLE